MKNHPTISNRANLLIKQQKMMKTHKKLQTTNFTKKIEHDPLIISQPPTHKILNSSNKIIKSLNIINSVSKNNLVLCANIKQSNPKKKQINSVYRSTPLKNLRSLDNKKIVVKEKNVNNNTKISKPVHIKSMSPMSKIKTVSSYGNTATTTVNTENNINNNLVVNNNNDKYQSLVEGTNIKNITQVSKSEMLQNNIFFNKIFTYISSLLSSTYTSANLSKNEEIKSQFMKLEQKISNYSNSVNVINADMLNTMNHSTNNLSTNQINKESNIRKEVYKTFFDFYDEICKEIEDLSNQINTNNTSLKKIDEVNSKLSSLHSKINFSKNESQFLNNNNINNINLNFAMNSNGFSQKADCVPSILISSLSSDFYQRLLDGSFKNESNTFISVENEDTMNKPNNNDTTKIFKENTIDNKKEDDTDSIIYNYDDSSSNNVTEREYANVPKVNINTKKSNESNNNNCLIF